VYPILSVRVSVRKTAVISSREPRDLPACNNSSNESDSSSFRMRPLVTFCLGCTATAFVFIILDDAEPWLMLKGFTAWFVNRRAWQDVQTPGRQRWHRTSLHLSWSFSHQATSRPDELDGKVPDGLSSIFRIGGKPLTWNVRNWLQHAGRLGLKSACLSAWTSRVFSVTASQKKI